MFILINIMSIAAFCVCEYGFHYDAGMEMHQNTDLNININMWWRSDVASRCNLDNIFVSIVQRRLDSSLTSTSSCSAYEARTSVALLLGESPDCVAADGMLD